MAKALFIGNGLNRVYPENAISWDDLLESLSSSTRLSEIMPGMNRINLKNPLKPFPLAFEELIQTANNDNMDSDERVMMLKEEIVRIFRFQIEQGKDAFNRFHSIIAQSNVTDIITSNYDYAFEQSLSKNFMLEKHKYANYKLEKTGNLRRSYTINEKTIWHMHGELMDNRVHKSRNTRDYSEQSILLGYSHYSKNLADIKDYVNGKQKGIGHVITRMANSEEMNLSWVDKFFTHDVDIIGFGLGFEEADLWWLLNYRVLKRKRNETRVRAKINNAIKFIIKKTTESDSEKLPYRDRVKQDKNNAVKEVLKAMDVQVLEIEAEDYNEFYDKYLQTIK